MNDTTYCAPCNTTIVDDGKQMYLPNGTAVNPIYFRGAFRWVDIATGEIVDIHGRTDACERVNGGKYHG